MKKPLIALSFAVASALALADSAQNNEGWFKGIGDGATSTNDMKATNGSWQFPATEGCATVNESGALVLALDEDDEGTAEEATFKITDEGETGTAQTLSVTGVFNPISAEDLLAGTKMVEKKAQVGFAVVGVESEGAMAYTYYAWVGATDGATAAADWVDLSELGAVADPEASTALTIELNYWDANKMTATFKIGDKSAMKTLTSAAAQNKKIASVSCTGSGTLSALNGAYQYAVAEADGKKYPTVEAAVASGASEVKLLKAAVGTVTVSGCCVTIDPNGKDRPTVAVDEAADNSKEATTDTETGRVTVQTKKTILEGVKVGTAGKGLMANEAGFRAFLNKHCKAAYTQANTDATPIKTALDAQKGTSGRTLWQSYALGVEPEAAVTPKQVARDTDEKNITLALPVKPTGDFTVTCAVGNGAAQELTGEAPTFKVPMTTGHYPVKVSFE